MLQTEPTFQPLTMSPDYTIRNVNGVTTLPQLYSKLENMLRELMDSLIRVSLAKLNSYKYIRTQSDELKLFINTGDISSTMKYLFEIFLEGDLTEFCNAYAGELNNCLNRQFRSFRSYIIRILTYLNIITAKEYSHYNNSKLFHFGTVNQDAIVNVHLKLRQDLFADGMTYNNYRVTDTNEIYYPISLVTQINFISYVITNKYDNVKYCDFITLLYLYILLDLDSVQPNNKLPLFLDIDNYTCNFLSEYTNQLPKMLDNVAIADVMTKTLYPEYSPIFNQGRNIKDVMRDIINRYEAGRDVTLQSKCINNIVLDTTSKTNRNQIFQDVASIAEEVALLTSFEQEVYSFDFERHILYYTDYGYDQINTICNTNHFGVAINFDMFQSISFINYNITFSDGVTQVIDKYEDVDTTAELNNIINNISTTITLINQNYKNLSKVRDTFIVYRVQSFMIYNSHHGELFTPRSIKVNHVLYLPYFLSTSYSTNFDYSGFVNESSIVLRITINKKSPNWIFLSRYSAHPDEAEILINKGCYFKVTKVTPQVIVIDNLLKDITVIDVTMYDRIEDTVTDPNTTLTYTNCLDSQFQGFMSFAQKGGQDTVNVELYTRNEKFNGVKLINTKVMLFDNSYKNSLLITNLTRYHDLLQLINNSHNSIAYKNLTNQQIIQIIIKYSQNNPYRSRTKPLIKGVSVYGGKKPLFRYW